MKPDNQPPYITLPVKGFLVSCGRLEAEPDDAASYKQAVSLLHRLRNEHPDLEWVLIAEVDV